MRRSTALAFVALIWLAACASAGDGDDDSIGGGGPDASISSPDAPTGGFPDAPTGGFPDAAPLPGTPDAAPLPGTPDAAPLPGTPDAAPGLFCNSNADCTVAGECCVNLGGPGFCAPGTEIGDLCLPQ